MINEISKDAKLNVIMKQKEKIEQKLEGTVFSIKYWTVKNNQRV